MPPVDPSFAGASLLTDIEDGRDVDFNAKIGPTGGAIRRPENPSSPATRLRPKRS